MTPARYSRWTVEEYLAFEECAGDKHEYVDGIVVARAVVNRFQALVAANAAGELGSRLNQCEVYTSDMKVQIRPGSWLSYPDVTVVCGEPQFLDEPKQLTLLNPTFVVEVLSPSTSGVDRGAKAEAYRRVPSLRGFLLVEPETVWIQYWSRTGDEWTSAVVTDIDATIRLEGLACELPVRGVYLNVPLPSPESAGSPPEREPSA